MAASQPLINVFKVKDICRKSALDCRSLTEILKSLNLAFDVCQYEDGWLIKVDCPSRQVLAEKDYSLSGKFSGQPYFLDFQPSQVPFPEKEEVDDEENTGNPDAEIVMIDIPPGTTKQQILDYFQNELPFGGDVRCIDIDSDVVNIAFVDEAVAKTVASKTPLCFKGKWLDVELKKHHSETLVKGFIEKIPDKKDAREVPKKEYTEKVLEKKVEMKTICIDKVPANMNLENLNLFFQNQRRSGGGEVEENARRDPETNLVEITFVDEKIAQRVVERSPLKFDQCELRVTLKEPPKAEDLTEENITEPSLGSDGRTIVVHGALEGVSQTSMELYFGNPRRSKGGEIQECDWDLKHGIKITFVSSTDAKNVLAKKNHKIDNNQFTVRPYIPPVMEEKMVLISHVKNEINESSLVNWLEIKLDADVDEVRKTKTGTWLIIFPEKIDFQKLKTVCKNEKDFLSKTCPQVRQIPVTNKIIVSDIPPESNAKSVGNYFKNPFSPDDFVSSIMRPDRKCIITFRNSTLAFQMSRTKFDDFKVELYNELVDGNEIYKDIPLPSPFWMKFLMDQKSIVEDELKDFGRPIWPEKAGDMLKIMCNGDIEEKQIKKSVDTLLATVHEEQLNIPQAIFEEIKEITQNDSLINQVYFDKENFTAHFLSFSKSQAIDNHKKMLKTVETKSSCEEVIDLEDYKINLLFSSKIFPKYKKLKIVADCGKIRFSGYSADISKVTNDLYKFLAGISSAPVQLSRYAPTILKKKPVKEYLQKQLKDKKYICAWDIDSEEQVLIYSPQKNNLRPAIDILKKSIVDFKFNLTEPLKKTMNEEKWKTFETEISKRYADLFHKEIEKGKLSIVTIDREAKNIGADFEKFFKTNVTYENTLPLKSGVYEFLKTFKMESIEKYKKNDTSVIINFANDQTLHISGSQEAFEKATKFLESLKNDIEEKEEIFPHFGFKKFLESDHADTMLKKASEKQRCVILKSENITSFNISENTSSSFHVKYENSEIILRLGDITELAVDVIVNAANRDLKHIGGLARAIVDKGGQVIQDESDLIMSNNSSNMLPEGSVRPTNAGKLECKMIAHAVGPLWQGGNNYEEESLAEAITNSLHLTEKRNYKSIAFPAISTGIFKFPLKEATRVIVSTIKEYLDNASNTCVKNIYLVSINQKVIDAFHRQLKSFFPAASLKEDRGAANIPLKGKQEQMDPVVPPKPFKSFQQPPKPQTDIEIILGSLSQIKCDVIVNTTNNSLDLSMGAVSKALLMVAGKGLQDECKQHPGLNLYDIAVTDGYNLPCEKVFHISLPHWSNSSEIVIKDYVMRCLAKADEINFNHIAIPAFGTGNLGYPVKIVAHAMFTAVAEYISKTETSLQKVSFVIYEKDTVTYQTFEDVKKRGPSISDAQTFQSNFDGQTAASSVSPQNENTFDIKGIDLTIIHGNIIEQTVDGIVHGTNQQFTLNGAISKALLNQIGPQFTKDCKSKVDEIVSFDYAITPGHSLPADYIVHVNIEGIKTNASRVLKLCFEAAERKQFSSLAIPPLGTGGLGCSVPYIKKNLLTALNDFAKSSPQSLKTVYLVIFNKGMFNEFCRELGSSEKGKQSLKSTISTGISNTFNRFANYIFPARNEEFELKPKTPSAVSLFFYANSLKDIEDAKKEIDSKYTSNYLQSKEIQEDIIRELPQNKKQIINQLQSQYEVKVEFKPSKIIVNGYKEDVVTVTQNIQTMLMSFTKEMAETKAAEMTQKLVQWSYMSSKGGKPTLVPYPMDINKKLEEAFANKQPLRIDRDSKTIIFDFSNKEEMCEYPENDRKRKIKILRKDNTKNDPIPDYWDQMEGNYLKVELKSSDEYEKVKKAFPNNFTIVKIERIQNRSLYKQYQAQLEKMNYTNPKGTKNETVGLWHGTSSNVTEQINQTGFNRSYCGKNATAYGQGVYFAVDPQYSLGNTYSPPDNNGLKSIYMCNVLTGVYCVGNSSMTVLQPNPQNSGQPYDSAVNNLNQPGIFVSFLDANAYPAYLITCK